MLAIGDAGTVISTILKHDAKVTSYKIALLRAINDVVLSYPDIQALNRHVAVPLRALARFWVAYYWPFAAPDDPIWQGPRAMRSGRLSNDMAFRGDLAILWEQWERVWGELSRPGDGFLLINEFQIPRKRRSLPHTLLRAYDRAVRAASNTIQMPIRYAGPGQWTVFDRPRVYRELRGRAVPIPGTLDSDVCLVVRGDLWMAFQNMSLYIEALCIHEWCLFTERVNLGSGKEIDRGQVYRLLTDRPDNRRPLTWERNQVDLLLMEGVEFRCPWTERRIYGKVRYDLDHILPVSVYPINELWNLVPSEPDFNSHVKRNRLPSSERLARAEPHLRLTYANYGRSAILRQAIQEDAGIRFASVPLSGSQFPPALARSVVNFVDQVATSRNLARF